MRPGALYEEPPLSSKRVPNQLKYDPGLYCVKCRWKRGSESHELADPV